MPAYVTVPSAITTFQNMLAKGTAALIDKVSAGTGKDGANHAASPNVTVTVHRRPSWRYDD